jgi:TPR repeat protein
MKNLFIIIILSIFNDAISAQVLSESRNVSLHVCIKIDSLEDEAANGSTHSMFQLAAKYDTFLNTSPKYIVPNCGTHISAIYWYTKAAEKGDVASMINIGINYDHLKAYDSAYYWFNKAYQMGSNNGLLTLYEYSKLKLVSKESRLNPITLLKTIKKLASTDQVLAWSLAFAYEGEHGMKKNLSKAIYWYRVALKLGDKNAIYSIERIEREKNRR